MKYDNDIVAKSKKKLARTLVGVGRIFSKVAAHDGAADSDAGSDDDHFGELDAPEKLRGIDSDSDSSGSELAGDNDIDVTDVINMFCF